MSTDPISIQIQCLADELKEMRMRMERTERRVQMLTDTFVVSGLWRTASSIEEWKCCTDTASTTLNEEDMLQFEMTND
jgi:hypothetical protein